MTAAKETAARGLAAAARATAAAAPLAALDAHFRWVVLQRYGIVHSISDPEMLADILTKCVSSAKFHLCAKTSVESPFFWSGKRVACTLSYCE